MRTLWRWLRTLLDFLTLLRVPVLIVVIGVLLCAAVPQVGELVDISLDPALGYQRIAVLLFALWLAGVVWISARCLVAFDLPILKAADGRFVQGFGKVFPRALGTAVPATLAIAYWRAVPYAEGQNSVRLGMSLGLAAMALAVLWFTWKRRALWQRLTGRPQAEPTVGQLERFHHLGPLRAWHWAGIAALLLSWIVAWIWPRAMTLFGPIACILGAAALAVWASTLPIYWAARQRFPLLTVVFLWACVLTWADLNDNHAVRLDATQDSQQIPGEHRLYAAGGQPDLAAYVRRWRDTHAADCPNGPILVSSEGGGIRAAMWTVLVISELDRRSAGRISRCVLGMSGVSGGSLGVAATALAAREQPDPVERGRRLVAMMEADLLSPLLGSLFGLDQLQRVVPWRAFSDRGQALEDSFVRAYDDQIRPATLPGSPFADPWSALYPPGGNAAELPVLLLNTTIVGTGERLVQHGFAPLKDFATSFHAAIDGATWFPPSLPLAHAVHNSARFTLASPAGTVYRMPAPGAPFVREDLLGQVVDGGYFENSGTETLAEFSQWLIDRHLLEAGGFTAIHISNDPGVEQVGPNDDDCRDDGYPPPAETEIRKDGELLAPVTAILSTRSARGALARQTWAQTVGNRLWHFRLCNGPRPVPLGWFIGPGTTSELRSQLLATFSDGQRDPDRPLTNVCQLEKLAALYGGAAQVTEGCPL